MRKVIPAVSGIYAIRNLKTNKVYVGSSNNMQRRWQEHKKRLRAGKHGSRHLQCSWNKYGENEFVCEVIERCDETDLLAREQYFIDTLKSANESFGYNASPVAGRFPPNTWTKGSKRSPEIVAKIAEQNKQLWKNPEYRARMIAAMTGRPCRLSEAQKKKIIEDREKKRTPEWGKRISLAQKGHTRNTLDMRGKLSATKGGLTDDQVRTVRNLLATGSMTQADIARLIGTSYDTVQRIRFGKRYDWVK